MKGNRRARDEGILKSLTGITRERERGRLREKERERERERGVEEECCLLRRVDRVKT